MKKAYQGCEKCWSAGSYCDACDQADHPRPFVHKSDSEVETERVRLRQMGLRIWTLEASYAPVYVEPVSPAPAPPALDSGFRKDDSGKLPLDLLALIPLEPLVEVAKAFDKGGRRYGYDNWKKGTNWRRYLAAGLRHAWAWARGKDVDDGPQGTGLNHLACAVACFLIALGLQMGNLGTDDRVKG